MRNWTKTTLGDVLNYEQPTKYIVESVDYKNEYKIPVLTAGKSFILGYTNEEKGVYDKVPVIIFDDFTTAIHYVDFPFKVKSSAMKILKADKEKADLRFLFYRMSKISLDTQLHKRYWISKFAKVQIFLPPLETQKHIAQILDDAAALRNKTEQLIKEYDALAQSVFLDMFGDTKLNPLNWKIATLSEICTEIIDCPHSTPNYVDYETEFPCIRTTELQNGNISWKKMKYLDEVGYKLRIKRLKPQEGDIIYGREGNIGEAALIPKNIKLSLGQRVMLFRANYTLVNNVFLLNVIRSKGLLHQALRKNTGSTVSHVNVKDIKNFKIILPDLELQKQFAEKIALIEQQKELAKQELKESEDLFNCLLQKAFKGELVL